MRTKVAELLSVTQPQACEYCNVLAAFIGTKCQRCTHSQKKYGPPVTCEQCRQKCAFVRKDEGHKVDGKLLCWLCTSAYKRALAKAKQNSARKSHSSLTSHKYSPLLPYNHIQYFYMVRIKIRNYFKGVCVSRLSTTSHTTPARTLQKLISQKEQQLLAKDRQISEIRADHASLEKELRTKLQAYQRESSEQNQELQRKIRALNKQVVTLTKSSKKVAVDSPS
ncbi:FAM76A [Cordylochernes scorpioides]|uniref:FAM76A n=1 Tax=Cordylochernes scorpioides TaxID=51811 RepID=A0ABY6L505_9ARAC|nr:FAM76A [Cordylochernes scorpioides]